MKSVIAKQCHSTEGQWLGNQVKGQSHQLGSLQGKRCKQKNLNIYSTTKTEDTEALRRERDEPSKIKTRSGNSSL